VCGARRGFTRRVASGREIREETRRRRAEEAVAWPNGSFDENVQRKCPIVLGFIRFRRYVYVSGI